MKRNIMIAVLLAWTVLAATLISSARVSGQAPQERSPDQALQGGDVPDLSRLSAAGLPRGEIERILKGFSIAPVPLNLQEKDVALVGLGSYIVNAQAACTDCHTNPPYQEGGDPFSGQPKKSNVEGYLAGGTAFGPFISRNLTPDAEGLPAGLTFNQFRGVMRRGTDFKNLPLHVPSAENDLLQVMPWPVYQEMTNHDLRAIYEYLKAIPSRPGFPRDPVQ